MSVDLSNVFCFGMNYKTANISSREFFSLDIEQERLFFDIILKRAFLPHFILLSTCNRFEIIGVDFLNIKKNYLLNEIFTIINEVKYQKKKVLNTNTLDAFYLLKGDEAIKHIFKVVSSLDSSCFGETQITGQFKKAILFARTMKTSHLILEEVAKEAIITNKKIRKTTPLKTFKNSISHQAINIAKQIFSNFKDKTFLFIGAGKMIEIACNNISKIASSKIMIANRTLKNAELLVSKMGVGSAHSLDNIKDLILKADIIISSTSSSTPIISKESLKHAQKLRKYKPLLIVDIALPRDFPASSSKLEEVYIFDLDDLDKISKKEEKKIFETIKTAETIIDTKLNTLKENWSFYKSNMILKNFNLYAQKLFFQEKDKTLSKNIFQNLTHEQKINIDKMFESISKKMLADIATSFKKAKNRDQRLDLENSIETLFVEKTKIKNNSLKEINSK